MNDTRDTPQGLKGKANSERATRVEWIVYALAALVGVGYVGPYLGRVTGYYEGLFSLAFVLGAIGLFQLYKTLAARKSGERHGGE